MYSVSCEEFIEIQNGTGGDDPASQFGGGGTLWKLETGRLQERGLRVRDCDSAVRPHRAAAE
jgi:hypothetical protein